MRKLLVVDTVALTRAHLAWAPRLAALAAEGAVADMVPVVPALTCPVQSSLLTGVLPRTHGVVANGWYFRDLAQVWLWRQSDRLVQAPKIWERLGERHPGFTTAKLFWWYNMYSRVDWSVTPRPHTTSDGRKFPGIYTQPASLEKELQDALGTFPLFAFWGPEAGIASTRWIAGCAMIVCERYGPDLALVYLPHLDYDFQRYGPHSPEARAAVGALDAEAGRLVDHARARGYQVLIVAEYAMTDVSGAVMINRVLRDHGYLAVRESLGRELLDCGASRAFAVADHQVAHVYVRDPRDEPAVAALLRATDGVGEVLDAEGKRAAGLDHPRSGELVALSRPDRWFAYPWWTDEGRAPDFARTVDIHQKPGYDPVELFYDPALCCPRLRAACKLLARRLGFRTLFDLIGTDPSPVKGSHGLVGDALPLLIGPRGLWDGDRITALDVHRIMARAMAGDAAV